MYTLNVIDPSINNYKMLLLKSFLLIYETGDEYSSKVLYHQDAIDLAGTLHSCSALLLDQTKSPRTFVF